MRRYTQDDIQRGEGLWNALDAESTDAEFVKSASVEVEESPLYTGARLPEGTLMKVGHERVTVPVYPGEEAPEWAKTAYDHEVRESMLKMAGFFGEAFHRLGRTLKNVLRGSAGHTPSNAADVLKQVMSTGSTLPGNRAVVDIDVFKSVIKGLQKADPLADKYLGAQAALAVGAPIVGFSIAKKHWDKGRVRRAHNRVEHALMTDADFENAADRETVVSESYGLMRKYAPNIALDPIVSKSFVKLLVSHPDQQNVEVIQNLMEAEKKFQDSREFSSDFRDIQKLFNPVATLAAGASK